MAHLISSFGLWSQVAYHLVQKKAKNILPWFLQQKFMFQKEQLCDMLKNNDIPALKKFLNSLSPTDWMTRVLKNQYDFTVRNTDIYRLSPIAVYTLSKSKEAKQILAQWGCRISANNQDNKILNKITETDNYQKENYEDVYFLLEYGVDFPNAYEGTLSQLVYHYSRSHLSLEEKLQIMRLVQKIVENGPTLHPFEEGQGQEALKHLILKDLATFDEIDAQMFSLLLSHIDVNALHGLSLNGKKAKVSSLQLALIHGAQNCVGIMVQKCENNLWQIEQFETQLQDLERMPQANVGGFMALQAQLKAYREKIVLEERVRHTNKKSLSFKI